MGNYEEETLLIVSQGDDSVTKNDASKMNQTDSSESDEKILLSTRESKAVADAIDSLAAKKGLSRSRFIRKLVHEALNQNESLNKRDRDNFTGLEDRLNEIKSSQSKVVDAVKCLECSILADYSKQMTSSLAEAKSQVDLCAKQFTHALENEFKLLRRSLSFLSLVTLAVHFVFILMAVCLAFGAFPWELWNLGDQLRQSLSVP